MALSNLCTDHRKTEGPTLIAIRSAFTLCFLQLIKHMYATDAACTVGFRHICTCDKCFCIIEYVAIAAKVPCEDGII